MTTPRGMFGVAGSGDTSGYGRLVRTVPVPESSPRPYGGYGRRRGGPTRGRARRQVLITPCCG